MPFDQTMLYTTQGGRYNGIKVGLHGESGVGKTFLASTLRNVLFINVEGGHMSLRDYNIASANAYNYEGLLDIYNWLAFSTEARWVESVFIDSMTEFVAREIATEVGNNSDSRAAYKKAQFKTNDICRKFKAELPGRNVVMTYKTEYEKTADGNMLYAPSLPNKLLAADVPYQFDMIWALRIFPGQNNVPIRWIQTQKDATYMAKSRVGLYPLPQFVEPNLQNIFDNFLGGING